MRNTNENAESNGGAQNVDRFENNGRAVEIDREDYTVCEDWDDSGDFGFEERTLDFFAEFAAGAGHEINNPLAIIRGRAQSLLQEETSPKRRRDLAIIVEQTRRAYEMIADVRLFARPPKPEISIFSLKSFFGNWVVRERMRCEKLDVSVQTSVEIGEIDAKVESDPEMMTAILSALGKNAVEAVANGGRLSFFCKIREFCKEVRRAKIGEIDAPERKNERIQTKDSLKAAEIAKFGEIGVENDGPELSDETRRLIFSPFFSGRQAGRGLGFGLPKAWRFAKALDVDLRCEKPKTFVGGTRWSVVFPLKNAFSNRDAADY